MTNIRKHKNFDSMPAALLAYELAIEAQNIILVMAAISAITPRKLKPEAPSFHWGISPVMWAIVTEERMSAGPEQSQHDR